MNTNPHTVAVTAVYIDGVEMEPDVHFTCTAAPEDDCRNYPACDCESWNDDHATEYGPGHEKIQRDECWIKPWFDHGQHSYDGEDLDDTGDYLIPAGMTRTGPVNCDFQGEYILWTFTEQEQPA